MRSRIDGRQIPLCRTDPAPPATPYRKGTDLRPRHDRGAWPHGYKLSAGTLYPILHGLEERGYLSSTEERTGSAARRVYRATPAGIEAFAAAKLKVRELFGELFEDDAGKN
jgi:DNA-binding PadR family transcriptional regulator